MGSRNGEDDSRADVLMKVGLSEAPEFFVLAYHGMQTEVAKRVGQMSPNAFILENVASLAWNRHFAYLERVLKQTLGS